MSARACRCQARSNGPLVPLKWMKRRPLGSRSRSMERREVEMKSLAAERARLRGR